MRPETKRLYRQIRRALLFPALFLNGWLLVILIDYLQPLVNIVISAALLAFLLDIPLQFIEKHAPRPTSLPGYLQFLRKPHIRRALSIFAVLLFSIMLVIVAIVTLITPLIQQANELANLLPKWADALEKQLQVIDSWAVSQQLEIDWNNLVNSLSTEASKQIQSLSSQLLGVIRGTFSGLLNTFLAIVLAVFFLFSGKGMWQGLLSWVDPKLASHLQVSVPQKLRSFIGGQMLLAFILSVVLSIIFALVKVPLPMLFGFLVGMPSFLPFCGAISQTAVSAFLTVQNPWMGLKVFAIALFIGQIFDNILTPRVMGDIIGLNPAWLLISVIIGAKVGGFLGILLAVPIASIIKSTVDVLRQSESDPDPPLLSAAEPGTKAIDATNPSLQSNPTSDHKDSHDSGDRDKFENRDQE
jgi:predicted PurR-regulated permease PerM